MQTVMRQTPWLLVSSKITPTPTPCPVLFILTLILWIFLRGGGGCFCVSLSVSLFIAGFFVSRKKHIFCSQCSLQKLYALLLHCMSPERWQNTAGSRAVRFICLLGKMKTEFLANRSQGDLIFSKWVSVTQGPNLSSGNDSFTVQFSSEYSFWEWKTS